MKPAPTPILPAEELYSIGETRLAAKRYDEARVSLTKIVERHPTSSYAARARFLIGETYYRDGDFDKAIREFETFLSFYPRHQIADLVQYRLAMSYYDQMKPVEQDQGLTQKALDQFRRLVKEYPESRYATEALAKTDLCRGRLAQKSGLQAITSRRATRATPGSGSSWCCGITRGRSSCPRRSSSSPR
jgi:outer membrane protein assembly factor BamD